MRKFQSIEDFADASGAELGTCEWTTINQQRVCDFAQATDDRQWIHLDVQRAERDPDLKGTIVHGFLILSLIPWLAGQISSCEGVGRSINYGLNKVRFIAMVRVGARVRVCHKLLSATKRGSGTQFIHEYTIEIEGETRPACIAEMIEILYPQTRNAHGGSVK